MTLLTGMTGVVSIYRSTAVTVSDYRYGSG